MTTLGEATFTSSEIDRFAALTLDRNPIHVDPRTAQRSFAGARVVHGMQIALTALESFVGSRSASRPFTRVRCEFAHPIVVDELVQFEYHVRDDGGLRLAALVDELPCAELRLSDETAFERTQEASGPVRIDEHLDAVSAPLDHDPREIASFAATISTTPPAAVTAMFPGLCAAIGPTSVSALARLSYVVGMLCPGLYSVFFSFDVTLARNDRAKGFLTFAVTGVDERFRLVKIALLAGDLLGTVRAFQRPRVFQQPTSDTLNGRVRMDEFSGCQALVIGGSRGLGELTAKLLCAGGSAVTLSYARGHREAQRVSDEITAARRGRCTPVALDILTPLSSEALRLLGRVDLVFYFPTPMIFRKKARTFNAAILNDFLRFYVERFSVLCEAIQAVATQPVRIFYPSSIAIDSRPRGLTEYAMAKAAGEILVADLNAASSKIQIVSSRLPRMGSDQTNTIVASGESSDSTAIMLSIIRDMWPIDRARQHQGRDRANDS